MATKKKENWRLPKILRILHARPKLIVSILLGVALGFLLPSDWHLPTRLLIAWDAALLLYLIIVYWTVTRSEASHIRAHAAQEDEGRLAVLILTVAASLASFAAIVFVLGDKSDKTGPQLLFVMGSVFLSWAFVHSIFALHYAHDYYRNGEAAGGLKFPGNEKPDYWDFVYFSFVIGMTFQVSDVSITARLIRRTATAHAIVAFIFNVALLAIMINSAASALK